MDLSIVIPVFNEEDTVALLYDAVVRAVEPLEETYELLLVDDGSTDATFARALALAERDPRLRLVKLNRNYGQTAALQAGFTHARGAVLVTLDGDLQNDPADIPRLLDKIREGYDFVAGRRVHRHDSLLTRKIPSRVANWLIRRVTGVSIRDTGCALRAYRAEVIGRLPLYSEAHRLIPLMLSLTGSRIAEIDVQHHPRRYGRSKYGLSRIYKVVLDLIAVKMLLTRYRQPLFGFGMVAVLCVVLSMAAFAGGLLHLAVAPEASIVIYVGTSLMLGSLSLFLVMLGILATLVYRAGRITIDTLYHARIVS